MRIIPLLLAPLPLFAVGVTRYAAPNGSDTQACDASARTSPHSLSRGIDCTGRGDTLVLLDGTYNLTSNPGIVLDYNKSGTSTARTVIRGDTKWGAKLVYSGPGCFYNPFDPDQSVFPIVIRVGYYRPQNTAFIDIVNLDISSAGGRGGAAIALYGHDSVIQGNRIHDMNCNQSCRDGFNFGVLAGALYTAEGNHQILENYVFNISLYAAGPCMEDDSIFYEQMHGRIVNNVILHGGGNAIQVRCNTGGTPDRPFYIVNNTITNMKGGGVVYFGNSGGAGCSSNACTFDKQHAAQYVDYLVVENNIISCGADPNAYYSYGIYEDDVSGRGRACMIGGHNYVKNNLVWIPNTPLAGCPATSWWTNIALSPATIAYSGGEGGPNNPAGLGTITANPQYVNNTGDHNGDYHLTAGSAAVQPNLAPSTTPSSAFPLTDFDGQPRLRGNDVDLGAYEYRNPALSRGNPEPRSPARARSR